MIYCSPLLAVADCENELEEIRPTGIASHNHDSLTLFAS
jgi:hypothetical protein